MPKKLPCLLCPKLFDYFEELMHHMTQEHVGMDSKSLEHATAARETKKQLGDYIEKESPGIGYECPECFELFSELDRLDAHRKKIHHMQFREDAAKKLKEFDENTSPTCEKCHLKFLGLIIARIDGKAKSVCFNCYEKHYGLNMLQRLLIGTPEFMITKMRTPLQ